MILIVDDTERDRENLSRVLNANKISYTVSETVEEALKLIGSSNFAAVVCDGMEGDYPRVEDACASKGIPFCLYSADRVEIHHEGSTAISRGEAGSIDKVVSFCLLSLSSVETE